MTRMGSVSHLADLRRYTKTIRASSKKSAIYSDYYEEDENKKENCKLANQRSISLGALHQNSSPLEPRMAQLETLEAKMASIEVSLSTTPRRKKSSSAVSTPVPPSLHSTVQSLFSNSLQSQVQVIQTKEPSQDSINTDLLPQCVKSRMWMRDRKREACLPERGRKSAQERLSRLRGDLDNKRLAIKNIKIALDTIDISDNIDVRIQQAELEYQLGREELNLLSIMEEIRSLQASLEENSLHQQTIFSFIGNSQVSLHGVELMYDPKSPQFGVNQREEGGILVEWASDSCGLLKGDRLLEVNGKLVCRQEEVGRLLNVAPSPAQVVVMRKHRSDQLMSHLQAELSVVKEKAGEAERTRDTFRRDNLRLTHRISYLEEQVAELLERAREAKPKPLPQVFQKGNQVALVANLPGLDKKSEGGLPQAKPRSCDEARSAKSVEVSLEKPRRKKELTPARSTHSLDVEMRRQRSSDHLHGEPRQRHLREARSSLFDFLDRTKYGYDVECGSESSSRPSRKEENGRPIPPKKPIRLSLSRATSLQSVENGEKKTLKRTHKGDAPAIPNGHQKASSVKGYPVNGEGQHVIYMNGHGSKNGHKGHSSHGHSNGHVKINEVPNGVSGKHGIHTITQSEGRWC